MARHPAANFHGGSVHNHFNSCLVLLACATLLFGSGAVARPVSEDELGSGGEDSTGDVASQNLSTSWVGILLSVSFLIILASMLALCGATGCCGNIQWFGRTRQDPPMSFSNPMTEPVGSTMMVPISQIDVRALELDPIVFEPLPTVHDLTPISSKIPADHRSHSLPNSHHRTPIIPIVPFSADDSTVYAHDWFEEPHNNFPRSNIEYVKVIGKGWFGQVIEAEARDIVPFARKIRVMVKLLREDANGIEQMRFLDESRMYRDANHGNILKLMGHSIEKLPFLLIMEHCPQGDLKSFLISNVIRAELLNSQGTIIKMALDVAKGLEWLHNAGFVHPDLASRNCQVSSENRVVIGDYGLGTQNFKDDYHWSSSVAIPLRWTAPETLHCTSSVIQILKVTESSNIWTLGVVIWEICEFGKLPYFELADDEVISRVIIDKNYNLGRPTLPYMSAKEELFVIMSSCWTSEIDTRPRLYTVVRQLEELYKTLTSNVTTPSKDEFESKWEQLGSRTNSEDDKRRKKNVSFLDLESQVRPFDLASASVDENLEPLQASSHLSDNTIDMTVLEQKELDAEEEQWTKKFERGEITQKVLEKSQSVQDLMVLTHFEQSDFGEMDSLGYITKSSQPSSLFDSGADTDKEFATEPTPAPNNGGSQVPATTTSSTTNNGTLRKSLSEPAIDSLSLGKSSQALSPADSSSNTLVPHDISSSATLTPGSTPNNPTGANLTYTKVTPDPPVEINVIRATPMHTPKPEQVSPKKSENESSKENKEIDEDTAPSKTNTANKNNGVGRKLHFRFDDLSPVPQGKQRHTSTPLRSGSDPSPRISDFEDNQDDDDDEDLPVFDGTFSLSPISQHCVTQTSFHNSKAEQSVDFGSVVMGASDDHELGSYQGVKSQLFDFSNVSQSDDEEDFYQSTKRPPTNLQKGFPRRLLFANGESFNEEGQALIDTTASSSSTASGTAGITPLNTATNGSTIALDSSKDMPEGQDELDNEEFWKQQMLSLQMAADSTREMFKTGLDEPEVIASHNADDRRFVEDIEADVEELGSLVLHDLEEPDSLSQIIKETRETNPDADVSAKLAFEDTFCTTSSSDFWTITPDGFETTSSSQIEPSDASSNDHSRIWDINSSIEIRKSKSPADTRFEDTHDPDQLTKVTSIASHDGTIELEDLEETHVTSEATEVSTDFVPSKWNQSLVPSRSAIKSPEQQPKTSGMKKSVSFEMKKTQLVYEYPPPPVASDSEEEEKAAAAAVRSPIASSSVPLASSLDWELTQEELEDAEINHEDWDDDVMPKSGDPMDVYRISGFSDDNFQVRGSSEPFVFSPSTLGELRHTKDRLRLDLSRGEANFLDDDPAKSSLSNPAKLDSGVGSSTNVSPFNNCDILTKRSKNSD